LGVRLAFWQDTGDAVREVLRVPRPLTFGLMGFPQTAPYSRIVDQWHRAEAMGFDSIFVADETPMEFPGAIGYEAWSLLGAIAHETTRVRIGTLVTPITFRHPLVLAMSVSTVDHISNGRVIVGIGAGGGAKDEAGVGVNFTPSERIDRLEEQLAVLDRLLRGETVTTEEGHYRMTDAVIERPIQRPRPPIVVAAQGPRGLRIAARYADIWNSLGGQPAFGKALSFADAVAATREQVARLEDACQSIGRDPATIGRSVLVYRYNAYASPTALAEYVGRYRELGFDQFVVTWPSVVEREAILEQVAAEVLPRLRAS
jgi:alkanesulfonate monooxygenase SsuD/methylene tetrahydromethanopterin reductase-like flavin-dependent oxidoreductase (luciferase family)